MSTTPFVLSCQGFLFAIVTGAPLGLLVGWYQLLDEIVSPLFDALHFVAPIAWEPFAALWFGTGIGGPIMIIFAGAFPPCVINVYRGAKFVDPRLIEAANMLGTPSHRVIREVLLPSSVPSIISGLRMVAGSNPQPMVLSLSMAHRSSVPAPTARWCSSNSRCFRGNQSMTASSWACAT